MSSFPSEPHIPQAAVKPALSGEKDAPNAHLPARREVRNEFSFCEKLLTLFLVDDIVHHVTYMTRIAFLTYP